MLDLREKDEAHEEEEHARAEARRQATLMRDANLEGIHTLVDDLTADDAEWRRLAQIPGLLDGWNEVRDKFVMEKDSFKTHALALHETKTAEVAEWNGVVQAACLEADRDAHEQLTAFEKGKKQMICRAREDPAGAEEGVAHVKVAAPRLRDAQLSAACVVSPAAATPRGRGRVLITRCVWQQAFWLSCARRAAGSAQEAAAESHVARGQDDRGARGPRPETRAQLRRARGAEQAGNHAVLCDCARS